MQTSDVHLSKEEAKNKIRCQFHCCHRCMWKYSIPPNDATKTELCKYFFLCPPHGIMGYLITSLVAIIMLWAATWSILRDDVLPGGNILALVVMYVACNVSGVLFEFIKLPALLGKKCRSIIFNNLIMFTNHPFSILHKQRSLINHFHP